MSSTPSTHIKVRITRVLAALATICIASYFLSLTYALSGLDLVWTKFFMTNVLWFLYLPFTLGLVYFYARVQLGRWLLEEGAVEEAMAWSSARLAYHFWLRGKREALTHRIVTARVHLLRGELDEARAMLWLEEPLPTRAPELLELDFLRALWAMRVENIKTARECAEEDRNRKRPRRHLAMRLAILAECEVRARQVDRAWTLLEESRWLEPTRYADFVEVLLAANSDGTRANERLWLADRESIATALEQVVPGALAEFWIACGTLLGRQGEDGEGRVCVARAGACVHESRLADPRSIWCWQRLLDEPSTVRASTWARQVEKEWSEKHEKSETHR